MLYRFDNNRCRADLTAQIQGCLDPTYLTIRRALTDCAELSIESKCTRIPGCLWNNGTCNVDEDALVAALDQNQRAAQELFQQTECLGAAACDAPCVVSPLGSCIFPDFVDFSDFVNSTTPFCSFIQQLIACQATFTPGACTGACNLADSGICSFSLFSEEFVNTTYESNPTLQAQMLTALERCPSITLPSACNAFIP